MSADRRMKAQLAGLLWVGTVLAACSAETPVPEKGAPAPEVAADTDVAPAGAPLAEADETLVGPIDWAAARADFAAANGQAEEGLVSTASGETTPVPILLPGGVVSIQSGADPRFRPLSDGYFATYPGIDYDIIVNGTNQTAGVETATRQPRGEDLSFTATAAGAQVTLSRYGADYLIEFECRDLIDPETGTCIEEAEALEIARNLVVAGTR